MKRTHARRDDQGEWLSVFLESRQGEGRQRVSGEALGNGSGQFESPFMELASK